jgi:hypothetical protein
LILRYVDPSDSGEYRNTDNRGNIFARYSIKVTSRQISLTPKRKKEYLNKLKSLIFKLLC